MKHPDEDIIFDSWKAVYYKNYGIEPNKQVIAQSERSALQTIREIVRYFLQFDKIRCNECIYYKNKEVTKNGSKNNY